LRCLQDGIWSQHKDFFKEQAVLQLEWASAKRKRPPSPSDGTHAACKGSASWSGGQGGRNCVVIDGDEDVQRKGEADTTVKTELGGQWAGAKKARKTPAVECNTVIVLD
jgi:hypothetical protein